MIGPGSVPFQNVPRGPGSGLNALTEHGMQSMHGHGSGPPPFTNNAPLRSPFAGPPGLHLTPAQAYCQQHEVTATVSTLKLFASPYMDYVFLGFMISITKWKLVSF